ncbi:hypothetical protein [Nocardia abscessus]|uniref:nSTAND1 domain-containing NTPase n=1 Tax=Nocardia abscessus TaxID=120957 RepID=UPI002458E26A|nr:hypothetical protein [Nocardia abscessus]
MNLRAWRSLWVAARATPPGALVDSDVPLYPEDGTYTQEYESIFFGRQRAVASMLDLVRASVGPRRSEGPVVLTGASGVGKSSLLRAGVLAALAAEPERWTTAVLTPSPDSARTLGRIVADARRFAESERSGHRHPRVFRRALVVVDQFEEVFRENVEAAVRAEFLNSLNCACAVATVVVSLRSDHLADCGQHPWLDHAVKHNSFRLEPMNRQDLTSAIVGPPRTRGVVVEPAVVELLLNSLEPPRYGADGRQADPGILPALHTTMQSMWSCRTENRLDIAAFRRTGGPEQSIRAVAERVWSELTSTERDDAMPAMLALVSVHHDGSLTRRRLAVAELRRIADQTASGRALIERLVEFRIITVDDHYAYLAHDALLGWRRLAARIFENRTAMLRRQRIEGDAAEWDSAGRDPELLYRSVQLATAVRHVDSTVSPIAMAFLRAADRTRLVIPSERERLRAHEITVAGAEQAKSA